MSHPLPDSPDLSFDRKQAKALLRACRAGDRAAIARLHEQLPRTRGAHSRDLTLADAQFVIARERGFESWAKLKAHIGAQQPLGEQVKRFLTAIREQQPAVARRLLKEHPAIVECSLHAAAAAADADRVAQAIARDRLQVSAPDDSHTAPILYACGSTFHTLGPQVAAASLRTVELLLDHGADPNSFRLFDQQDDTSKLSALYFTCVSNNVPVVRLLLERGAGVNDGESVYHAAELNHRECLELLEAHGEDLVHRHPRWKNTPLYFLVGHHHDDRNGTAPWLLGVTWLLERGADPNVTSDDVAEAPLHKVAASPTQSPAVASLFIAHGADVNLPRADGRTPYVIALRCGNAVVADLLRANGATTDGVTPIDALLGACMVGDAASAHAIVAAHPNVVASLTPEDRGMFAQAVWTGRIGSVSLMAAIGFDLTWEASWGGTPLHHAAWLGKPEIVRLLLGLGAPVNVRDLQFGSSPIAWAAHGSSNCRSADDDYCAIVDLLVDAGSDYAASINKEGEPPESLASRRVAKRLEERGFTRPTLG